MNQPTFSTLDGIFKTHPTAKIKIWRYTNLAKFMSLVQTKSLYFSRADKLGDNFEGSTQERLLEVTQKDPRIKTGLIQYIDYEKSPIPKDSGYWPFVHKRLFF